jgi:hypothetical protein
MTKKKETTQAEAARQDKPKGTDIEQDLDFQRRMWLVQRIGWVIFGLIVAAGLAGLLGTGPLADAKAAGSDGFEVEYERFAHRASPTMITIHPGDAPLSEEGTLDIAFTQDYLKNFTIERIIPEPDSESLSGENLVYSFKVDDGGLSTITLHVNPAQAGTWNGQIGPADGDPAAINQFVYP